MQGPAGGPRILLVDDNPEDRALAVLVLKRDLPSATILEIGDAAGFASAMSAGRIDLAIIEQRLAWSDGVSLARALGEAHPRAPVILFAAEAHQSETAEALRAGVTDFLIKSSHGFLRLGEAASTALEEGRRLQLAAPSEPWLETLLERAEVAVLRSTRDPRRMESTPALLRLLDVDSLESALGTELLAPYADAEAREEILRQVEQAGGRRLRRAVIVDNEGGRRHLMLAEVLVPDSSGEPVLDVLFLDPSALLERERELLQRVEALESSRDQLGEFAYVASHELQEPLRMLEKYSVLLAEEAGDELQESARESLQFIHQAALQMQRLVSDLLAYSRVGSREKRIVACDCNQLLQKALSSLQAAIEESGAEIETEPLPTVMGDPLQLGQLFQNLLNNAIKFRAGRKPKILIGARQEGDEWVLSVRDNGIGIEADDQERVFGLFTRLDPEIPGTGIGLALCRRVVERHDGRMWLESKPGKGTTFFFTLPVQSDSVDSRAEEHERQRLT